MSQEIKTFDDVMHLLPAEIEYSRAQNIEGNVPEKDGIRHLGQGFMPIIFWLNHAEITLDQAEQFRIEWQKLSGYQAIYENKSGNWSVSFPQEGEVVA